MSVLGICGAGGLGREVLELARCINERKTTWDKMIFINNGEASDDINGISVYSLETAIEEFGEELQAVIGIGEPAIREKVFGQLKENRVKLATLIHPDVRIPDTTAIGQGVVINMANFISCNVTVHDNVYIQPHASVGHDCILEEGCVISVLCNISGTVHVGRYTYVGSSSCVRESITIGDHSIIGMFSAVHKNIPDEVIAYGNPAKPVKKNENKQIFAKKG